RLEREIRRHPAARHVQEGDVRGARWMAAVELRDRPDVQVSPAVFQEGIGLDRRDPFDHGAGDTTIWWSVMAKPPHLRVVAAVIARGDRYLITQRRPTAVLAGLWEFPGGKVEEGETDALALAREVRERVGVEVTVAACIGRRTHDYDGYSVDL